MEVCKIGMKELLTPTVNQSSRTGSMHPYLKLVVLIFLQANFLTCQLNGFWFLLSYGNLPLLPPITSLEGFLLNVQGGRQQKELSCYLVSQKK